MSSLPRPGESPLLAGVRSAIRRSTDYLLARQHEAGYWNGELSADTTLESDYILLQLWLHPPRGKVWNPPGRSRVEAAAASILARQSPGGGYPIYAEGPPDVSASVKAYFALKLAGQPVDSEPMRKLRRTILSLGGIQAANSYVKLNLSLFGLYPREGTPSIPPEMMLGGRLIYEMSSWTRAIVVPLAIVQAADPRRPAPDGFDLRELFLEGVPVTFAPAQGLINWRRLFLALDRFLKFWEKRGSKRLRAWAIREAEAWMIERFADCDGLGAIFPPMMYAVMALDVLGYPPDHPLRVEALEQFERLWVGSPNGFLVQPCFSPVWDTAHALFALEEGGAAPEDRLRAAADWLLSKEVRKRGDWSVKRPDVEPSGWYFEFANEYYPDIDDTAQVLLALGRVQASGQAARQKCVERAIRWLVAMQSKDGGWSAFDVDNNWSPLSHVPFADHNAMLDPTCPDITGRVLESLCRWGLDQNHPSVRRAVRYLLSRQEQDGSWYGRWGVNYIYGTFLALRGLRAAGEDERSAPVLRAAEWLRSIQNADGGWGESCASYAEGCYVEAASTPSQTAWAVLGLLAAGDDSSRSIEQGVDYLVRTQTPDGGWHERLATGTGFPCVFYLNYHLYRQYFPLLALGAYYRRLTGFERDSELSVLMEAS